MVVVSLKVFIKNVSFVFTGKTVPLFLGKCGDLLKDKLQ